MHTLIRLATNYNKTEVHCINTLAAPVLLGIMLKAAALPPLQSFCDGPSTVFCVAETHAIIRQQFHILQSNKDEK